MSTHASTTEVLAAFVSGAGYDDIPDDVRTLGRRILVDGIGVGIAGAHAAEFAPLLRYADGFAGTGAVPSVGGRDLDVSWAALLAGAAIHVLDYDDVLPEMGHSAAVLVPVVLSLGHALGSTGRQALTAVTVGAEVGARLGAAMNPAHYGIGWHPTSVLGTLASAAAAASLLDLSPDETATALGLAAAAASGTKAGFGSLTKCVQVGGAARSGIEAALLSRAGATSNRTVLDRQFGGFCDLFSTETDRAEITAGLGTEYALERQGIRLKFLPCCGSIHSAVYGILAVVDGHDVDPDDIVAVVTELDPRRLPHTDRPVVRSGLEGKFSVQYCQATAAVNRRLTMADFADEVVSEPRRQELMTRIELRPATTPLDGGPSTGSRGARVSVTTRRGTTFEEYVAAPKGAKENPCSDADIEAKFLDCAGVLLDGERARSLFRGLRDIDGVRDVSTLVGPVWGRT
ncbi:MAG: hypothetical protein GEV10_00195 [Streptosporangiales bacterium]|nr:hypothetical protein [Streptosporangiales bacterium]